MKNLIRAFLLLTMIGATIGLGTSCAEENNCAMTGRPMIYCNIYTLDVGTKTVLNDTLDSLTVTALGTDSIIINNQKKVHSLLLPLRYTKDSTVLIFHYDYVREPKRADTVYIAQTNTPYFESMECGYSISQQISKVTFTNSPTTVFNRLDSVYITNKDANTNGTTNIKLFYRY